MSKKQTYGKKVFTKQDYPDVQLHIVSENGREVVATYPKMKSRPNLGEDFAARGRDLSDGTPTEIIGKVDGVQHHREEGFIAIDVLLQPGDNSLIDELIAAGWEEVGKKSKS